MPHCKLRIGTNIIEVPPLTVEGAPRGMDSWRRWLEGLEGEEDCSDDEPLWEDRRLEILTAEQKNKRI